MSQEILIVDDEIDICRLVADTLTDEGYHTRYAVEATQALDAVQQRCPQLAILDIWLGDSRFDGIKLLELIRQDHPHLPIIMMSGHGTIETAVQAIKMGAYDFIEKPFKIDRLLFAVARALEHAHLRRENDALKAHRREISDLTGKSPVTQQLRQLINRVATTNSRIVITGKAGSGKETVARLIHQKSSRRHGPFVTVNCAALAAEPFEATLFGIEEESGLKSGLLEQAHRGVLLLDEVGNMPLKTQAKMVRYLQDQIFQRVKGKRALDVDVRVLASSRSDLKEAVQQGTFREDLFHRLNVVSLQMPSLYQRREDIPLLVEELMSHLFLSSGLRPCSFTPNALKILQSYDWPGNIRQLKTVIEWVLILATQKGHQSITQEYLPQEICASTNGTTSASQNASVMDLCLKEARESFEKEYLQVQIQRFGGNISRMAEFVDMERSALHRKLRSFQIGRIPH